MVAYRITDQVAALFRQGEREQIRPLRPGAIVIPRTLPDVAGMIEATCDGSNIVVFSRDLSERSEPIETELAGVSN